MCVEVLQLTREKEIRNDEFTLESGPSTKLYTQLSILELNVKSYVAVFVGRMNHF